MRDDITNTYNFSGQLTKSIRKQHAGNVSTPALTLIIEYTYDHRGRLVDTWKTADAGTRTLVLNANSSADYQLPGTTGYTYDANRNMKSRVNSTSTGNNLRNITYNYFDLPQVVTELPARRPIPTMRTGGSCVRCSGLWPWIISTASEIGTLGPITIHIEVQEPFQFLSGFFVNQPKLEKTVSKVKHHILLRRND